MVSKVLVCALTIIAAVSCKPVCVIEGNLTGMEIIRCDRSPYFHPDRLLDRSDYRTRTLWRSVGCKAKRIHVSEEGIILDVWTGHQHGKLLERINEVLKK